MREIKVGNELAFQYYHRLQEIKRFIEEHYMEEISLKKAARVAGLEKKYFWHFQLHWHSRCVRSACAMIRHKISLSG